MGYGTLSFPLVAEELRDPTTVCTVLAMLTGAHRGLREASKLLSLSLA